MSWRVLIRPEVEQDIIEAAIWYETRHSGLGVRFVEGIVRVFDLLAENPLLNRRRHGRRDIRWQYLERFPYRVIYEVIKDEQTIIVATVLHAARGDRHWKWRL